MKKILLNSFVLIATILIISCNSEENNNNPNNELLGTWNLYRTTGMIPNVPVFNNGQVIWVFNSNNTVDITNTIVSTDPNYIYTLLPTGNYSYSIDISNGNLLTVNGQNIGKVDINGNIMLLNDNVELDGFLTEFHKN
ncbi:hypothetical protein H9X57_14570 [Flavobacterium piscinae]|uniref:Lipocalin-like domain-containing protein n=1 Tax=Flavobacterium piscinae TaxID=2506424 RepID=A0A4Q1KWV0_9FLAO|nr:hypothetical protein [Flavobacterium piscinae]MBC8884138.1 hypothetical protein [Flavobacterium piscinae]RXR34773.1 hypothetical protein EQG68_02365 [Flavobacterium piscinae]